MFVATGKKKNSVSMEDLQLQVKGLGQTVTTLQQSLAEKDKQIADLQMLVATAVAPAAEGGTAQ